MSYAEYLTSAEWKQRRADALERAGHRCQVCAYRGANLEVHHNSYDNIGSEPPEDLVVLCRLCHSRYHRPRTVAQPMDLDAPLTALKRVAKAIRAREAA